MTIRLRSGCLVAVSLVGAVLACAGTKPHRRQSINKKMVGEPVAVGSVLPIRVWVGDLCEPEDEGPCDPKYPVTLECSGAPCQVEKRTQSHDDGDEMRVVAAKPGTLEMAVSANQGKIRHKLIPVAVVEPAQAVVRCLTETMLDREHTIAWVSLHAADGTWLRHSAKVQFNTSLACQSEVKIDDESLRAPNGYPYECPPVDQVHVVASIGGKTLTADAVCEVVFPLQEVSGGVIEQGDGYSQELFGDCHRATAKIQDDLQRANWTTISNETVDGKHRIVAERFGTRFQVTFRDEGTNRCTATVVKAKLH